MQIGCVCVDYGDDVGIILSNSYVHVVALASRNPCLSHGLKMIQANAKLTPSSNPLSHKKGFRRKSY